MTKASVMANTRQCNLIEQGRQKGACDVLWKGTKHPACTVTLSDNGHARLIRSVHLSRPENYLSIYQSGCNLSCRKCHSWEFSKVANGSWYSAEQLVSACKEYQTSVTLMEPRERVTSFHAAETCRCCGQCVGGDKPPWCPGVLTVDQILLSPQGYGPARNVVGFTGGDLTCRPAFYCRCAELIKGETNLWVLIETNGFGLTDLNLKMLRESGVDAFWLDIKAFENNTHLWLTGVPVTRILGLPEKMVHHGFVLEVLSLYIPGVVEGEQLKQIARLLAAVDPCIPFTILAFFPEHEMLRVRSPTFAEMQDAYLRCRDAGLKKIRLGNTGTFVKSVEQQRYLTTEGIW